MDSNMNPPETKASESLSGSAQGDTNPEICTLSGETLEKVRYALEAAERGFDGVETPDGFLRYKLVCDAYTILHANTARHLEPCVMGEDEAAPWDIDVVAEIGCVDVEYVKQHPLYAALGLMNIYPAAVSGTKGHDYSERTEFMDGWNSAILTITRNQKEIERALAKNTPLMGDAAIGNDAVVVGTTVRHAGAANGFNTSPTQMLADIMKAKEALRKANRQLHILVPEHGMVNDERMAFIAINEALAAFEKYGEK